MAYPERGTENASPTRIGTLLSSFRSHQAINNQRGRPLPINDDMTHSPTASSSCPSSSPLGLPSPVTLDPLLARGGRPPGGLGRRHWRQVPGWEADPPVPAPSLQPPAKSGGVGAGAQTMTRVLSGGQLSPSLLDYSARGPLAFNSTDTLVASTYMGWRKAAAPE